MTTGGKHRGDWPDTFQGYPPPVSNTTYTPNQFFDVVLPHASRGTARLVAYMLRKTLGWCDAEGNPQEPHVIISYNELINTAGISRGAISAAAHEAIAARYIKLVRKGRPSISGKAAISALYELAWDDRNQYVRDPKQFQGFYAGNGNLTYIPNAFFDHTVPNEPLAVVKVVGAIIRHTIGFQTRYGFRRQQVAVSFTHLQRLTGIASRRSLNEALQTAIAHNHVVRLEEGYFDTDAGQASRAAIYGIKWSDAEAYPLSGSKKIPDPVPPEPVEEAVLVLDRSKKDTGAQIEPVQKGYRPDQFKMDTGSGSEKTPAPVQKGHRDRFKNQTDIEIKPSNNTTKQQQSAVAEVVAHLKKEGFDQQTAKTLAKSFPADQIQRQCDWLEERRPARNRLGMLRKSIEEDWPAPESATATPKGAIFAAHFYAAWAGNEGPPAAAAVASDVAAADRFVGQLLKVYPHEDKVPLMARRFGEYVRDQERDNPRMPRSLRLALARHGDEFVVAFRKRIDARRRRAEERARHEHEDQFQAAYQSYVLERAAVLQEQQPLVYSAFEAEEAKRREALATSPYCSDETLRAEMLAQFDEASELAKRFVEFFHESDEVVLSFWQWDKEVNSSRFGKSACMA